MPRRNSKSALIHRLAREDALNYAFMHGPMPHPGEFYEMYFPYSQAELAGLAETIEPRKPGRPKTYRSRSRYLPLIVRVHEVQNRRPELSERRACQIVADKFGVSAAMLRKFLRSLPS